MKAFRVLGILAAVLLPSVLPAQQSALSWEEGVVGRVDVALFEGRHVDKPGHVSVFRATGCTYVKKCGWVMTVEVQQTNRKLILEKKIPVHNRIVSMHYEDVDFREGDHIRLREGSQGVYALLDRDGKSHDFSIKQVVELPSQLPPGTQKLSASAEPSVDALTHPVKALSGGTLGVVASDWRQGDFRAVEIIDISEDGSAALVGLRKGDVITEVNGKKLESAQELNSVVGQMEPGSKVNIVYLVKTNLGWVPKETSAILAKRD
jgi:membrane-associated protease RseP (regulator of RpoE activity)